MQCETQAESKRKKERKTSFYEVATWPLLGAHGMASGVEGKKRKTAKPRNLQEIYV
jgi:hypothetical protein